MSTSTLTLLPWENCWPLYIPWKLSPEYPDILRGNVDISMFTRDFPWAMFILLFFDTRVWTIFGGHRYAGLVSSFFKVRCKDLSLQQRERRGSSRGRAPTLGGWVVTSSCGLSPLWQFSSVAHLLGISEIKIWNSSFLLLGCETLPFFSVCNFWTYFIVFASHLFFIGSRRK